MIDQQQYQDTQHRLKVKNSKLKRLLKKIKGNHTRQPSPIDSNLWALNENKALSFDSNSKSTGRDVVTYELGLAKKQNLN